MTDRPILRFPNPIPSIRRTGPPRSLPQPSGPGRTTQGQRFQRTFDRLSIALDTTDPEITLRADPGGIAPERALVFITAGSVANFTRAARDIGMEVFAESALEDIETYPDGFAPPRGDESLSRTLYATMPTLSAFEQISSLWNAYQREDERPTGAAPWWNAFDCLLELRPWGPEDRLTQGARATIEDRLPFDENEEVVIEIEIWPTTNARKREDWRVQTEQRINALGGQVIDRSSISESGFIYEALLAKLPALAIRAMLNEPEGVDGLVTLEGVQFILPQTIGQAGLGDSEGEIGQHEPLASCTTDAPMRAALFDGTAVAGHAALDGGVIIEDIHDLVSLSVVSQRFHATAMASLILRGDLESDGHPLQDTRLVNIPLLIDADGDSRSPENRLFVDLVHIALVRLLSGEEPLAPDVFIVNFSIGISDKHFAGQMSALARLVDWWAVNEGVLFVISAGNISEPLFLPDISAVAFEGLDRDDQRQKIRSAMRASAYDRTLLSPAEALNGISVGAVSKDLSGQTPFAQAGIIALDHEDEIRPQMTSALGLGLHRTIKPDLLQSGGRQEVRANPNGANTRLSSAEPSQRTGLVVATPRGGLLATQKMRGTSPAAALTTRSILQAAEALTGDGGPYEGLELPRMTLSLLGRALAINAARWPDGARDTYREELTHLGRYKHARAKEAVCKQYGYGVLAPDLMQDSPGNGVTMVGYGSTRKNQAQIFRLPLPESMSGDRIPRSMRVTITWFSPTNPARAQYRLASLEAVAAGENDGIEDSRWNLNLKSDGPDANMIKRGSVWSKRLIHNTASVPYFDKDAYIPIRVQCRDVTNGGLSPDDEIEFAIAVTLEIETEVQYDIHNEIEQKIRLQLHPNL